MFEELIMPVITAQMITGMTISTAVGMALLNQQEINLDYIMLGGEKFVPVKKSNTRLYNGYGPTEFTVCSSFHIIDQEKDIDIPIGRAVPNSYSMICDSDGHILPKGIAGELCLAGVQISEGYHNRPEQTAKAFTYLSDDALGGNRIYRTGDLARYNEDNELVYLGVAQGFARREKVNSLENVGLPYPVVADENRKSANILEEEAVVISEI